MAVVGDAYIIVRAVTTAVKKDIADGFKDVKGQTTKAGEEAGDGFSAGFAKNFNRSAEQAREAFGKLIRRGYYMQSAFGAAAGSVSALVGGIGAFVGVAGAAASSGVALGAAMAQIKVASLVGKSAFKGISEAVGAADSAARGNTKTIKELREELQQLAFAAESAALAEQDAALGLEKARETLARVQNLPPDNRARREAELAYQQAELKYRQAKDKNKDAQDEINNPKKSGSAAADPFAKLTESQKVFAKYLVSIKGRFKELNEASAKGFLPALQAQMENMFSSGYFDMLVKGYEDVGRGLGKASQELGNSIFSPKAKDNLASLFESTGRNAGTFGRVLGNVFRTILTVLKAADPLLSRFLLFLDNKTAANASKLEKNFSGISAFFKEAGKAAAEFGAIFGNIFAGLSGMIKANMGPGSGGRMMLDSLRESTTWMRQLNTAAGQFSAANYFKTTAETTMSIFRTFAGLGRILKDLGTMPETKEFWDILRSGQDSLEKILRASVETGPGLARLLVSITEILAAFTDSDQVNAYFDVLNSIVGVFTEIFDALQPVMKVIGPVVGAIGALITATLLFKKVALITYGLVLVPMKAYAAIQGFIMARQIIKQGLDAKEQADAIKKSLANAAVTTSYGVMGIAADATGTKAALMWAKIGGPITLILAGLVAVAAAAVAIGAAMAEAVEQAELRAFKDTSDTLRQTAKNGIDAADSIKIWGSAVKAATDDVGNASGYQKTLSKSIKTTIQALNEYEAYKNSMSDSSGRFFEGGTKALEKFIDKTAGSAGFILESANVANDAKQALTALNKSFANLAKGNIVQALGAFRQFADINKLSRTEVTSLIKVDKAFQTELTKHAESIGLVVKNQKGFVDINKLTEVALGDGAYAARLAKLEFDRLSNIVKEAAASFIDIEGAISKNTTTLKDGNVKFNLSGYIKDLGKQVAAQKKWADNMVKLRKAFGAEGSQMYEDLLSQGKNAAGLVNELANGTEGALKKYIENSKTMADELRTAKVALVAFSDSRALFNALSSRGSSMAVIEQAERLIKKYGDIAKVAAELGVGDKEIIDAAKRLNLDVQGAASEVNIKAAWESGTLDQLKRGFEGEMGTFNIKVAPAKKDGGIIGSTFNAKGTLGPKLADGGRIFGPGGPRQDKIQAWLSNGEYVVNAASTAKNLAVLEAINSGKSVMGGNVNVTVNAAPGMSEQDVANLVANRLTYELQKGFTS